LVPDFERQGTLWGDQKTTINTGGIELAMASGWQDAEERGATELPVPSSVDFQDPRVLFGHTLNTIAQRKREKESAFSSEVSYVLCRWIIHTSEVELQASIDRDTPFLGRTR
jgi:hypothetical protein